MTCRRCVVGGNEDGKLEPGQGGRKLAPPTCASLPVDLPVHVLAVASNSPSWINEVSTYLYVSTVDSLKMSKCRWEDLG